MPLKIRCPHCFRKLVADDDVAGEPKACPACGEVFNVPLPRAAQKAAGAPATTLPRCPRCDTELVPTASYCHRCHTDLQTGRRLPLKRRLRLVSPRTWALGGCALVVAALLVYVAAQFFIIRSRDPRAPFRPTMPAPIPAAALAQELLGAGDAGQRRAALASLAGVEQRAAPAVARALAAALESGTGDLEARRNQVAAIELLARNQAYHTELAAEWIGVFERCEARPALREAALRARGMIGDARALDDLRRLWLEKLRRRLLLARVARVSRMDDGPAIRLVSARARRAMAAAADGLRVLARDDNTPVFEQLAEDYWQSWTWLGQGTGDGFAEELFALAGPSQSGLEFKPEDVRQPRDIMKRVAQRGSSAARAAAGLVLEAQQGRYRRACRAIADTLAEILPDCAPADQQRLTWAIGRLRGRLFGTATRDHPLDVTATEIEAAQRWARPGFAPNVAGPYPPPPILSYRLTAAARLLEQDLLRGLRGGWPAADEALDDWLVADLGFTPRLRALIDPGQRRPVYPALAAALVCVAVYDEQTLRPELELWREAVDQPAWVRALAYTVLGSLDARRGRWASGWPAGLDLGNTKLLDAGTPGWEHFGRAIAAGGPVTLHRLADFQAVLAANVYDKLIAATRRASARAAPEEAW